MFRHRRRLRLVAWLICSTLVAACNGDGSEDAKVNASETTTTAASARPEFLAAQVQVRADDVTFPQTSFTATAGDITVAYVNEGEILHSLLLETSAGEAVADWPRLEVPNHGDLALGTVSLSPGSYVLYCDIPGHRIAGMEATLTVAA